MILFGNSRLDRFRRAVLRVTGRSARVERALGELDLALLHVHFATDAVQISGMAKRLNIPLVVTLHGNDITEAPSRRGWAGQVYRARLRRMFCRASKLIAVSEFIADKAVQYGADRTKVVVHPIGIHVPRAPIQSGAVAWDIIFVGRLVEKKGVDDLLAAVQLLSKRMRPRVVIVGAGPNSESLVEMARALNVDVEFAGALDYVSVRNLMASARIVVVPSKTSASGDAEGLPMVVLEAGSLGLPVVATRHAGIPEAIEDGVNGLLVPEADPEALADALEVLLGSEVLCERMGQAAHQRVLAEFDLQKQNQGLELIYDEVVAGFSKARRHGV